MGRWAPNLRSLEEYGAFTFTLPSPLKSQKSTDRNDHLMHDASLCLLACHQRLTRASELQMAPKLVSAIIQFYPPGSDTKTGSLMTIIHNNRTYIHTYISLTALCPGLPRWAGTRNVKSICILLKQDTVSGSCISCAVCKSAPRSRQITTQAPHRSVFLQALPTAQPTASKHWRQ